MKPTDIIRQLPSREAVSLCIEIFNNLEQTVINPNYKEGLVENYLTKYGSINRDEFTRYFLSTLGDIPWWSNPDISLETYNKLLALDKYYQENPDTTLDPFDSTVPDKIWLGEHEKVETTHEEALKVGEEQTQKLIEKTKERIKREAEVKEPEEAFPEVLYIVPQAPVKTIELSKENQEVLKTLVENARKDEKFSEKIAREIAEKVSEEQKKVLGKETFEKTIEWAAKTWTEDLKKYDPANIPAKVEVHDMTEVFSVITSPEVEKYFTNKEHYKNIVEATKETTEAVKEAEVVANDYLTVAYGPTITGVFFNKKDEEIKKEKERISLYGVTTVNDGKSVGEIKLKEADKEIMELKERASERRELKAAVYKINPDVRLSDKEFEELYRKWIYVNYIYGGNVLGYHAAAAKYQKSGQAQEAYDQGVIFTGIFDRVGGKFGLGFYEMVVDGKNTVGFGFKIAGKTVPLKGVGEISERIARKFASAGASKTAVKASVSKATTAALTKLAAKTGVQSLITAAGSIAPIVGNILAWIAAELLWRLGMWVKNHYKDVAKIAALGLGGLAVGLGSPILGAAAGGALLLGVGPTAAVSGIVSGIGTIFGGLISTTLTTLAVGAVITAIVVPVLVGIILFIINTGAYMVPPSSKFGGSGGGGGIVPPDCQGNDYPKPASANTLVSGNYAFPVAPFNETSYPCYHWDGEYAVDVFTKGTRQPVVAYTSGTVNMVVMDDSMGGKYVILAGSDGRFYYYAHNCAVYVQEGDSVSIGDIIAVTDNTGSAAGTPEHLHFAINESKYGNLFIGGGGSVCPQTDFEEKFGVGVCPVASERCVRPTN